MRYYTGIQQLDSVLKGGLPPGVSEVFGEDASGKSTLCFSVMREASLRGLPTALVQSECLPDRQYMNNCGVHDCVSVVPLSLEAAFESAYKLIAGGVKVVVFDSLTGFECDVDYRNPIVGERAKYAKSECIYQGLELLHGFARENKALVVVVNQLRTPIGSLNPKPTSAYNRILKQFSSTRIRTYRESARNEYGVLAYVKVRFHVVKSIKSPPNKKAWGFLFNQRGFDPGFELLRECLSNDIAKSAGAYFRMPDGSTVGPGYIEAAQQINQNLYEYRRDYERKNYRD